MNDGDGKNQSLAVDGDGDSESRDIARIKGDVAGFHC